MNMSEAERKQVIDELNKALRELNHIAFDDGRDRAMVESIRQRILNGLKLIYEQETIIKGFTGDYGDACDVDGVCERRKKDA